MNFFGRPQVKEDPLDQAKKWKREIIRQARRLDRDISAIERAEKKAMKECQKYAKKGELKAAKTLAKEIVSAVEATSIPDLSALACLTLSLSLCVSLSLSLSLSAGQHSSEQGAHPPVSGADELRGLHSAELHM